MLALRNGVCKQDAVAAQRVGYLTIGIVGSNGPNRRIVATYFVEVVATPYATTVFLQAKA